MARNAIPAEGTEAFDSWFAHRMCELTAIVADIDRAETLRAINDESASKTWSDSLALRGYASTLDY